jgi:hypothetical protein
MASGHVNRTQRPNTWLHRPSLRREDSPCQLGAVHTWHLVDINPVRSDVHYWRKADMAQPTGMSPYDPKRTWALLAHKAN